MDIISFLIGGFWKYVGGLPWWQGLTVVLIFFIAFIFSKFGKMIFSWIGEKFSVLKSETITLQYRMFWGLSNDALNIQMKDEVRRSFKENGFDELSGNDFAQYVKNQSKILISILRNHIINLYPPNKKGIIVSMEQVLEYIDKKESSIEDIFFEIYIEAKRVKKQGLEDLKKIDEKFEQEISRFVSKNKEDSDCRNCFVILFGKREIAENKKSVIKILKGQMNFAEQKLSEIHSNFLSFYSEKLNKKHGG